jgi:hypothetical protein
MVKVSLTLNDSKWLLLNDLLYKEHLTKKLEFSILSGSRIFAVTKFF